MDISAISRNTFSCVSGSHSVMNRPDLNYSDLILTAQIFSLCKDERKKFI